MTPAKSRRYCGRDFSPRQMRIIRRIIAEDPDRSRFQISKIVCETLGWFKPGGGLKDMSCRVAMLRMQKDGLIQLPPPRNPGRGGKPCRIRFSSRTLPEAPVVATRPSTAATLLHSSLFKRAVSALERVHPPVSLSGLYTLARRSTSIFRMRQWSNISTARIQRRGLENCSQRRFHRMVASTA